MSRSRFYLSMVTLLSGTMFYSVFMPAVVAQDLPEADSPELIDDSIPKKALVAKEFPGSEWEFFSGKKDSKFAETWSYRVDPDTKVPFIACSGQPYGYIRTKKNFRNFDFGLEWRFPQDENGNSGVLLFTNGDDRIWPTSLQVQLQQPLAGSSFPSGSAKSENELRNVPMLSRPVNQWNRCIISAREGNVTIVVNDQKVGTVAGCKPLEGAISLQSEGSEIHFRNIWVREYPSEVQSVSKSDLRRQKRLRSTLKKQGFVAYP